MGESRQEEDGGVGEEGLEDATVQEARPSSKPGRNMVAKIVAITCTVCSYDTANALLVKASSGVKKGTKMSKVDLCFSSNKLTK